MVRSVTSRWVVLLLIILSALAATGCNSKFAFLKNSGGGYGHFSPDDDTWDRLQAGMRMDIPNNPRVRKFVKYYLDNPATLDLMQRNAQLYLFHIVDRLDRRGMPLELAFLPAVESNYTPTATSRSGAAGIWQFIQSTGKVYGLDQDHWYDGRRDLVASTDAALDYLAYLNKYFDGDWELAIAAYNGGEGRVSRSRGKNEREGKDIDFWSLDLRQETADYVPRLFALATIFKHPKRHGIELAYIPNRPTLAIVETDRTVDLSKAAEMTGLDKKEFCKLNAAYVSEVTTSREKHRLLVPINKADELEKALKKLPEIKPQRTQVASYRVKKGDTLSSIARRHKVSQKDIRIQNNLRRDHIQVGQVLSISGGKTTNYRKVATAPIKTKYRVKKGDTLWSIAQAHNVSVSALCQKNGISKKTVLKPGQNLKIPRLREAFNTNGGLANAS